MASEVLGNSAVASANAGPASQVIEQPHTIKDLGIRRSLVQNIALKILYLQGELILVHLAEQMRVGLGVVTEIFELLRKEQLLEVKGMVGGVQRVTTTTLGNSRAHELLSLSHYAGPVPISLDDYTRQVRAQSIRNMTIHTADVEKEFAHLVLHPATLEQLGTAIMSGRSMLLHGPSGVGKTVIAETIAGMYRDYVWVPYAIEAGNQIVTVFDPNLHDTALEPVEEQTDRRWVRCRRPRIFAGGDLRIEMLDLQFNPVGRYHSASLQMKANNGVLVVDDFGRQQSRPEDLLNRWLVPLEHDIDFLNLFGGGRLFVPFDVFVVFATGLDPSKLADETFLRRVHTKSRLSYATPSEYHEIFRRVCTESGLTYDAAVVDELIASLEKSGRPLRPCDPGEIVQQIRWAAGYVGKPPCLDSPSVEQACRNYFFSA